MLRLFLITIMAGAPITAKAQDTGTPLASPGSLPETRIEADEEAGVIRFVVEGNEVALLDSTGLHVRESVSYGGTLTDYGRVGFDAHPVDEPSEQGGALE